METLWAKRSPEGVRLGLNVVRATAAPADGFEDLEFSHVNRPNAMGRYNDLPPFAEPTCTVLPVPFTVVGERVVVVAEKSQVRRHGHPHAGL